MTDIYRRAHTMLVDTNEDGEFPTREMVVAAITPDCSEWLHEALLDDSFGMGEVQRAMVARMLATAIVGVMWWSFERDCEAAEDWLNSPSGRAATDHASPDAR